MVLLNTATCGVNPLSKNNSKPMLIYTKTLHTSTHSSVPDRPLVVSFQDFKNKYSHLQFNTEYSDGSSESSGIRVLY